MWQFAKGEEAEDHAGWDVEHIILIFYYAYKIF